jgi:hypothetical protein
MLRYLVVAMSGVHLPRLRPHLVILRPILLSAYTCKVPNALLIVRAVKVHTLFDVVIHMEGINCEVHLLDDFLQIRKVLPESVDYMNSIRAYGIIAYVYIDALEWSRAQGFGKCKI